MGLLFFPRGGSAQVARYLAAALGDAGWSVSLVAGSLGPAGQGSHAPTFFAGIDLQYLDYTAAVAGFETGASAVAAPVPMHPSYEDREGAPDPVLAAVDPALADHLASVWEAPFAAAGADRADVFHLHHLTSQHDAVARRWPQVPLVAHLHGTELKLIEAIEARAAVAGALDLTLAAMPDAVDRAAIDTGTLDPGQLEVFRSTRWSQWRHGEFWLGRLRRRAGAADHLVVVSPADRATAISLLGVEPERVTAVPNGVDTDRFRPLRMGPGTRRDCFRRWLVDDPQGWDESGVPGSIRYREADLDRLLGSDGAGTVLMFVGRFTAAKRVPLLLRGPRPGPRPGPAPGFAVGVGRPSRRVGGRAPRHRRPPGRPRRRVFRRLAGPRRSAPSFGRLRRHGHGLGQRLVSPGATRSDGRGTASDRHPQRRVPVDDQCRPRSADRLAGGTRRRRRAGRRVGRGRRPSR